MYSGHSRIGIAQISFFMPCTIAAAYLLFIRHKRLRAPWYFLLFFSLVRVATGICVVLHEDHPTNTGLTVVAAVLLALGVVPLLFTTLGLIHIILDANIKATAFFKRLIPLLRMLFLVSASLIVAGGSMQGVTNFESLIKAGQNLIKAGYITVALSIMVLFIFQVYVHNEGERYYLTSSSKLILKALIITDILLMIRIIYSFLSIFCVNINNTYWSPLYGSVTAFAIMVLSTECIIVGTFVVVGFSISTISEVM